MLTPGLLILLADCGDAVEEEEEEARGGKQDKGTARCRFNSLTNAISDYVSPQGYFMQIEFGI